MQLFSQRDSSWANHLLGWGGVVGTIGQYGCYVTVCAMIATDWLKTPWYPSWFDDAATAAKVFLRDPTGTYDFLSDHALDDVFPGRFKTLATPGFRADLIAAAIASPTHYAYVHIVNPAIGVATHFVLMWSTAADADPWYGAVRALALYGGPSAVVTTYIVSCFPEVPAAAPAPVVITVSPVQPPKPIPLPTPPPIIALPPTPTALYAFKTGEDAHPTDGVMTFAAAVKLADAWSITHGGTIYVNDTNGNAVHVWPPYPAGPPQPA